MGMILRNVYINLMFKLSSIYWVLCTLIDKSPILSNFIIKVSDSPMTAMVLVFLVHAQCIDKDKCQKLVKLS